MPHDVATILGTALDDLLALPGVRATLARHLRTLADALETDVPEADPAPRALPSGDGTLPTPRSHSDGVYPRALPSGDGTPTATVSDPPDREAEPERLPPEVVDRLLAWTQDRGKTEQPLPEVASPVPRPSANLHVLAERFRLKACTARRVRQGDATNDLTPQAHELNTRLWMQDLPPDTKPEWIEHLAGCYDVAALAAERLESFAALHSEEERKRLIDAASHASSLLAGSINRIRGHPDVEFDPDARDLHGWLRHLTYVYQIYQPRYLSLSRMASLCTLDDCRVRLEGLTEELAMQRSRKEALGALRYHIRRLVEDGAHAFHGAYAREGVVTKTVACEEAGIPASSRALREVLLEAYDLLPRPDDAPPYYLEVLRYLEEELERQARADEEPEELTDAHAETPVVQEVRRLLAGRSIYLLGGVPVPSTIERVREAFGLREVIWPETRVHQSVEPLRSTIWREDLAVVLQLIRYSSHNVGDLREECRKAGKPFVRVRGGYGLVSLAHAILNQASDALLKQTSDAPH